MGGGGSTPQPARFSPGNETGPIVKEAEWTPGPVWTGAGSFVRTGIRFMDLPARSESPSDSDS